MRLQKFHIEAEWDEGHPDDGGDGYWISLKKGFKSASDPVGNLHTIHEDTKKLAWQEEVLPCNCTECCYGLTPEFISTSPRAKSP